MDRILEWLKRLFSANFIIILLTGITAWLAYKQFSGNLGGEVVPVIYSSEKENGNHCTLICKTNDTVYLLSPQLFPQFKNISKRAIHNFRLEYTIVSPFQDLYFQKVKYEVNNAFSSTPFEVDVVNHQVRSKHIYKTDKLFAQDETPCLFNNIEFLPVPEIDSFYRSFAVECRISWDGKKDVSEYASYVNFRDFTDTTFNFFDWAYSVYGSINGTVTSKTDLLLAFHLQQDSMQISGTSSLLKDLELSDLDSLCIENYLQTHPQFYINHLYGIHHSNDNKHEKVEWSSVIIGIISLILAILFFVLFCHALKVKGDALLNINFGVGSAFLLFGSIWCFETVFSFFNLSWGCLIVKISVIIVAIISLFYATESIYFLIKGVKRHNKDVGNIIILIIIAAYMIGTCYATISYLL